MIEINKCLEKLKSFGIFSEFREGAVSEIYGGDGLFESGGIRIIKKPFNISFENNVWIVRFPGEGQLINEIKAHDLEDATEKVIDFYR